MYCNKCLIYINSESGLLLNINQLQYASLMVIFECMVALNHDHGTDIKALLHYKVKTQYCENIKQNSNYYFH